MLLRRHRKKKEEVKVIEKVQKVAEDEVPENKDMEIQEDNQEIKELEEIPEENKEEVLEVNIEVQEENKVLEELTIKELKDLLDEKGIEYNAKAKKEELIKLLEGAE